MDDLSRLPFDCQCGHPDCVPDPDPATDYALPGGVRFGSERWYELMAAIGPADPDEFLSEYDILAGDRPFAEEIDWFAEVTRDDPTAYELAMMESQLRSDHEQHNGFLAALDEGDSMRWYREDVEEF